MFKNSVDNIAFFKGALLRVPLVRVLRKLCINYAGLVLIYF